MWEKDVGKSVFWGFGFGVFTRSGEDIERYVEGVVNGGWDWSDVFIS